MSNDQHSNNQNGSKRLIGWLISYEMDQLGRAYEIRAGRTLISAEGGNKERLISINAKGVSSPHLALSASSKHKILVQDIFSEQGSYVTRCDSQEEKSVSGPFELQHGDWLRIGAKTRFQLCLIDKPGR